ncbi:hypothetical protein ACJIZ3_025182 [Penstemon smallii]|uniref:NAC domain-containing protein n=1 Tax=Penstemon smallii TaxID=265156 RepID=A0ABD3TTZ4_9LAMI
MLPGFRFHPTDEELVGFYLRRKIQHKPLSIELIKQLDIYKYDPWDLPKLATTGEKEWYFYCPRDRKYRNSARPNRVTGAGFWKATGTDRPIYSSSSSDHHQGSSSKCIGLKKSLVFYKGRAAKGIKTDWMMHEFRLPSLSSSDSSNKRSSSSSSSYLDKNIPPHEAWAICRIFKKANSNTQRALSHSWVSPVFDNITTTTTATISDMINPHSMNNIQFSSSYITMANKTNTSVPLHFGFYNDVLEQSSIASTFSPLNFPPCNNQMENNNLTTSYTNTISSLSKETASKCGAINDASSLLLDMSTSIFGDFGNINGFLTHEDMQGNVIGNGEEGVLVKDQSLDEEWGTIRSFVPNSSFPLSYPEALKSNLLMWDSSSPCPSELSTSYSTNKSCYSTT